MSEGFMGKESQRKRKMENRNSKNRLARKGTLTKKRKKRREKEASDEEIENEQQEAQHKENGRAVDAVARKVRDGADESNRYSSEAGFLADGVERAYRSVTGEVAAEKGKLMLEPDEDLAAAAPHERDTGHE